MLFTKYIDVAYFYVFISMHTPFCKWNTEQVCSWLEDSGLGQYVNLARQWVDNGQTLLSATPQELEKVYPIIIIRKLLFCTIKILVILS